MATMPVGLLLALAIASEVAATLSLRSVGGFTPRSPSPSSSSATRLLLLLSLVVKQLSVGTTYAIWAGAGTAVIAVIGIVALGEPATALQHRLDRADHRRRDRPEPLAAAH